MPFSDIGPVKTPDGLDDEQVVFLTDGCPTGYLAVENADIEPGETVQIWGCGPVGQFAIRCAWMFGAGRVIAIDRVVERPATANAMLASLPDVISMHMGKSDAIPVDRAASTHLIVRPPADSAGRAAELG